MPAKKTLQEKASFFRILIAEQFRQFFAIPFKLTLLVTVIFFQASSWVTSATWIETAAAIVFWYLVINIVVNTTRVLSVRYYLRRKDLPSGHKDNFTTGLKRVSTLLAHVTFFFVFLHLIGIEITQFFTSISLVAVAIVLIFREYLANFLSGVVTLFTDDVLLGDFIEVGGFKGTVVDITLLHVELKTDAGDSVFVPNVTLGIKEVINFSRRDKKTVTVEFTLPKAALKKLDAIEQEVQKALKQALADVIAHDKVWLQTEKIEKDAAIFAVKIPFTKYSREHEKTAKRVVSQVILSVIAKTK